MITPTRPKRKPNSTPIHSEIPLFRASTIAQTIQAMVIMIKIIKLPITAKIMFSITIILTYSTTKNSNTINGQLQID